MVYFLSTWRCRSTTASTSRESSTCVKHAVLPVLGMIAVGVPVYYLVKPGQPSPLNWFPYAALGVIVVSVIYAF